MFSKHSQRDPKIAEVEIEEALQAPSSQEFIHTEPRLDYCHYEPILDPESEFPWHHPDAQIPDAEINVPEIDMTQFYDPWDIYKGHIPPSINDSTPRHIESQKPEDHEEMRKYAWDYVSPQHYQHEDVRSDVHNTRNPDNMQQAQVQHVDLRGNMWEHDTESHHYPDQQYSHNYQEPLNYIHDCQKDHAPQYNVDNFQESHYNQEHTKNQSQNHYHSDHSQHDNQSHYSYTNNFSHDQNEHTYEFSFQKDSEKTYYPLQQPRVEHVYYVHLDHEKMGDRQHHKTENAKIDVESEMNGCGEADCEIFENIRPRHPYDGFYLRHRMTIDSRGRKVCTHEVPPTPTSSPPESPIPEDNSLQGFEEEENEQSIEIEDQTGVAGNFARMVLGAGAQREALDDLTRRQGWEAGNIDYMGADAFDNIWAKISQTLNQPRSSPPKQSTSPPAQVPAPVERSVASPPPPSPVIAPAPAPISTPAESNNIAAPVAKVPEPEPAAAATEPEVKAPILAAATTPAKVVAAVPTEPTPAAEAPVVAPVAVAAAPIAAAKPATIPPATSEAKQDAVPVPKSPPPAKAPSAVAAAPSKPASPKTEVTPVKGASSTDSPPLANTPSKEELPVVPAVKSEERRKPAGRLQLPPAAADALPTPDSELEDAATLAHAIIAGELRTPATPTITAPTPPTDPALPLSPVSLSQIGVEAKPKTTTAARIESSVTAADPPKKKVVKKVLKKENTGGGGVEAPVPPPRKKEKKPKEK